MRVIVEGNEAETKVVAVVIRDALQMDGIPVTLTSDIIETGMDMTQSIARCIESLQNPVEVLTSSVDEPNSTHMNFIIMDPVDGPTVKGTLVTVNEVVELVRQGQTWQEILKTHPELTQDDISACVYYKIFHCPEYAASIAED